MICACAEDYFVLGHEMFTAREIDAVRHRLCTALVKSHTLNQAFCPNLDL